MSNSILDSHLPTPTNQILVSHGFPAVSSGNSVLNSQGFNPSYGGANTLYVNAAASPGGNGSVGAPYQRIGTALAAVPAGGGWTVQVADGVYSNSLDEVATMTTATSGNWNTLKAANDGGVKITAGLNLTTNVSRYWRFEGLKFDSQDSKTVQGGYFKFFRCAFRRSGTIADTDYSAAVTLGTNNFTPGAHHILMEDCWSYGYGGRYKFLTYNAEDCIFRRCVSRFDGSATDSNNPEADINIYDSRRVEVQNHIALDTITNDIAYTACFYNAIRGTVPTPNADHKWRGCIGVNINGWSSGCEGIAAVPNPGFEMEDCATYGTSHGVSHKEGAGSVYRRMTVVNSGGTAFANYRESATFPNTLAVVYNNSGGATVAYSTLAAAKTQGLWYLPRREVGSSLLSGGNGAQIVNKIGVSGTLYGETGYKDVTADPLWPFPNQARILADFSEAGVGYTAIRGWTASGKTLTNYIWELLGNTGAP